MPTLCKKLGRIARMVSGKLQKAIAGAVYCCKTNPCGTPTCPDGSTPAFVRNCSGAIIRVAEYAIQDTRTVQTTNADTPTPPGGYPPPDSARPPYIKSVTFTIDYSTMCAKVFDTSGAAISGSVGRTYTDGHYTTTTDTASAIGVTAVFEWAHLENVQSNSGYPFIQEGFSVGIFPTGYVISVNVGRPVQLTGTIPGPLPCNGTVISSQLTTRIDSFLNTNPSNYAENGHDVDIGAGGNITTALTTAYDGDAVSASDCDRILKMTGKLWAYLDRGEPDEDGNYTSPLRLPEESPPEDGGVLTLLDVRVTKLYRYCALGCDTPIAQYSGDLEWQQPDGTWAYASGISFAPINDRTWVMEIANYAFATAETQPVHTSDCCLSTATSIDPLRGTFNQYATPMTTPSKPQEISFEAVEYDPLVDPACPCDPPTCKDCPEAPDAAAMSILSTLAALGLAKTNSHTCRFDGNSAAGAGSVVLLDVDDAEGHPTPYFQATFNGTKSDGTTFSIVGRRACQAGPLGYYQITSTTGTPPPGAYLKVG